jgi:hypothetical protein
MLLVLLATSGLILAGRALQDANSRWRSSLSTEVHHRIGNAYVHLGDEAHTPNNTVQLGQVFYVYNKYIRDRLCHVFVTNLLINEEKKIAHHYSMFVNWFDADTYEFNEFFIMPEQIPPGHYKLIKKSTSYCSGEVFYTTHYKLDVNVVPKAP